MTAPVTVRERDRRALAGIVSEDRPDVPDGEGLPLSLLAELMGQIRCDAIAFQGFDCQWQKTWFVQGIPDPDYAWHEENDPVHWQLYWDCQAMQLSRSDRRPAQCREDLGLLLRPAMAFRWHVL